MKQLLKKIKKIILKIFKRKSLKSTQKPYDYGDYTGVNPKYLD